MAANNDHIAGTVTHNGRQWAFRRQPGRKTWHITPPSGRPYTVTEWRFVTWWLDVSVADLQASNDHQRSHP